MSVPQAVKLFSPKFDGSRESWEWICHASNGRQTPAPKLNDEQIAHALRAGYLTNAEECNGNR